MFIRYGMYYSITLAPLALGTTITLQQGISMICTSNIISHPNRAGLRLERVGASNTLVAVPPKLRMWITTSRTPSNMEKTPRYVFPTRVWKRLQCRLYT
jgi:hypothetical protein